MADMTGASVKLNMDLQAIKECTDLLGTVYAECLNMIIIVDFSWAAQALWSMLKPMLAEATKNKFAFVSESEARQMCKGLYPQDVYERICSSFDMARNSSATDAERAAHAHATAVGSVPLGPKSGGE